MTLPKTKYLKDYTESDFMIEHINLHIDLYETHTIVRSIMRITRSRDIHNSMKVLVLDGVDLELISISMDGSELNLGEYEITKEHLIIFEVPIEFVLNIQTKIKPHENTSLSGMYVSGDIVCTQCEAEGFRKITYFLDRPDIMSNYTCTIEADQTKYPVLLSNGNLIQSGCSTNNRHWATWEDPFPKPCYLFAIVAGDLQVIEDYFITESENEVTLRIYAEKENIDRCYHAMESLKKAMEWDEKLFDLEYDLEMYMIVAINDFNMGAMENKGLNIFNAKYILATPDTATDEDFFAIERVIAHEYFHNWTGNRITLQNWFQLCLKEGLTVFRDQLFAEDMAASPAIKRIQDVQKLRLYQFPEDDGPMAHPVRPESYIEMNNFYTMTVYEKGAEVVRMLHNLLEDDFYKGMEYYFIHFDGKAVTVEDFIAIMEDAAEQDLTHFKLWYTQAGTPVVQVDRYYNKEEQIYELSFKQTCHPTPGQEEKAPLVIPVDVALIGSNGKPLPLQLEDEENPYILDNRVLQFNEESQTYKFINVPEEPVPSVFRDFSACVKISMDYTFNERLFLMTYDSDAFNRWEQSRQIFLEELYRLIIIYEEEQPMTLNQEILAALETILSPPIIDKAFTSELLKLPSEVEIAHYVYDKTQSINPDAIYFARMFMKQSIAISLSNTFFSIYKDNRNLLPYSFDPKSVAERSLKNIALDYLVRLKQSEVLSFALDQYNKADNMTDAFCAFRSLSTIECQAYQMVCELFYEKWKHNPIVLDKWFMIQALSPIEDTQKTVKTLLNHKDFSLKNPNRVRSLLGTFAHNNHYHFHRSNGMGYKLLADQIIILDKKNPQIASRLVSAFNHWKKYDYKRQSLINRQLNKIMDQKELSKDVYEIVSKALG